jgi:hypothetical protein
VSNREEDCGMTFHGTNMFWKDIYRIAFFASITIVVFIPVQIVVFILSPPPQTVEEFFKLFHYNALLGLLSLDLLLMIDYVLMVPIFLAIYVLLKKTNQSVTAIGVILGFIGIIIYFSSNTSFDMLYLSQQYDITQTDTQQSLYLLAAGQSMLATFQGTSFHVSYVLLSLATLILSFLMLKDNVFGRKTGLAGILLAVVGLGLYIPVVGFALSILSLIPGTAWYLLVAKSLYKISKLDTPSSF